MHNNSFHHYGAISSVPVPESLISAVILSASVGVAPPCESVTWIPGFSGQVGQHFPTGTVT